MEHRDRRFRVLPIALVKKLSPQSVQAFRAAGYLMPMAGADGEGDRAGSGNENDAASGRENESSSGSADDTEDSKDGNEDDDGEEDSDSGRNRKDNEDDKDDDDRVPLSKSEYERLKRIAREHDQAEKRRRTDEQKQRERLQKEQGNYEELLAEKDEQIRTVETERDQARYELDAFKRRVRVTEAAKRLNFKDPDDAFRFLSDEDTENETSTERALKRLARQKSYLVSERRGSGAPINGDGATLTAEQLKTMTTEEINARWPEVQKALAQQGNS